jgi:hypothetical protein
MSAIEVKTILGGVNAAEAGKISAAASEGLSKGIARPLFYPYYWFSFRETTQTILGASSIRISCLVDGRTGVGATSDPFDVELRRVAARDVLSSAIKEPDALKQASRLVRHAPKARRRALVGARRELVERCLVYKPFWVVSTGPERALSVVVDAVTGASWWVNRA